MIRPLKFDEIRTVLPEFGELCYQELKFGRPFNDEHFVKTWEDIYRANIGIIFVKEDEGQVVGGIGGLLYIDPFDQNTVVQGLIYYLYPEYRDYWTASHLLVEFEDWSRRRGARYARASAPEARKGLGLFLERNGYRYLEQQYEKELL